MVETIQVEEQEATKTHNILKNWHVHYGEVYEQLYKARDTLSDLYNQQKIATAALLQQQLDQQIRMELKHID